MSREFTGKRVLKSIPVSDDLRNKRRVARFFEGIERAKAAFDKAPQGKKYAEFFRVMDTTISGWQAFRAKDAEVVEEVEEGPNAPVDDDKNAGIEGL